MNSSRTYPKFDLSTIPSGSTIGLVAKRESGKSWICRDLIKNFSSYGYGACVIICPTDREAGFYKELVPESYISYRFSENILERIFQRQKAMIRKCKKYLKQGKRCDPRLLLIMDDCLADDGEWKKSVKMNEIFLNGRHIGITFVITIQNPMGIGPSWRGNLDYTMLLKNDNVSISKKLYDNYAGVFDNHKEFRNTYEALTKDYRVMVINNKKVHLPKEKKIGWYKANNHIPGGEKLFSKQYNRYHELNYNKKWEIEEDINKGMLLQ
jgi:hypothetical protein